MSIRPTRPTAGMKLAAAKVVVANLVKDHLLEATESDEAANSLAENGDMYMDGYEIAKRLDDRCYWNCDLQMADALDDFGWELRKQIEIAEKAWFEAENPVMPLPIGARITISTGRHAETGTIDGIYDHGPGKYLVKIDGDPDADGPSNSRRIVNWEDAVAA